MDFTQEMQGLVVRCDEDLQPSFWDPTHHLLSLHPPSSADAGARSASGT